MPKLSTFLVLSCAFMLLSSLRQVKEKNITSPLPATHLATPSNPSIQMCLDIDAGLQSAAGNWLGKTWKPGQMLRIKFLGGHPHYQAKVRQYAQEWANHANIRFKYVSSGFAEIRIHMLPGGSWSLIGNTSTYTSVDPQTLNSYPSSEGITMNYGWFTPQLSEEGFRRVIYHEFGHSLGLLHEHQSPAGGISWNEKVYAYYLKHNNWNKDQVKSYVLDKYNSNYTQFSAYDRASIMHYPIDSSVVDNDAHVVPWNTTLSPTDKAFIAKLYPKPVPKPQRESEGGNSPNDARGGFH